MAKTPAAFVLDQDPQARFEMKRLLTGIGLSIAGEASYGMEGVALASELRPDVIVIGVNEPMERPLQTIQSLINLLPDRPVIVYSDSRDIDAARKAMLAGARDFLVRPVRADELRDSVLKAMEAEENRRLHHSGQAAPTPTQGTIVTIFGAKGGIGKSTLATNLAVSLAMQDKGSVAILDLDNGFSDVAGMLDVKPERGLLELVNAVSRGDADDVKKYMTVHEATGLNVLAGPPVLDWRGISADDVRPIVDLLARTYDTVLVDTSGMLNEFSELAVEIATILLWITTTEYASVCDSIEALRALRALSYADDRIRVVLNSTAADDNLVRSNAVQEALQRPVFWTIPYDKRVRQGTHLGQPIVVRAPQSPAARSYAELASVLSGGRSDRPKKSVRHALRFRVGAQTAAAGGG